MSDTQDWFFTDTANRRIGFMWPDDALAILDSVWGKRKGIGGFATYTGMNRATIERYCNGKSPIPRDIAVLILLMQKEVISRQRSDHNPRPWHKLPQPDAPWLPGHEPKKRLARRPMG